MSNNQQFSETGRMSGKAGFAGNWVYGGGSSRSVRRRVMAILRASCMVLGFKRRNLGLGSLAPRGHGSLAALGIAAAIGGMALPDLALAQYAAGGGTATATGAIAIGGNSGAPTTANDGEAIAIGSGADAEVNAGTAAAIAIGWKAVAGPAPRGSTLAIGTRATATSPTELGDQVAIGTDTKATGQDSIAIGAQTTASGTNTIAIGNGNTTAGGADGVTIGVYSTASGDGATIFGNNISAGTNTNVTAVGLAAKVGGNNATAIGANANAAAAGATAIGSNTTAGSSAGAVDSVAIGGQSVVNAGASSGVAIGRKATVSGAFGIAQGDGSTAAGVGSIAMGLDASTSTYATNGLAVGTSAKSKAAGGIAIGEYSEATGHDSVYVGGGAGQGSYYDGAAGDSNMRNVGFGALAGSAVNGQNNSAVGATAGSNVGGNANVAVGAHAGSTVYGFSNVAIGGVSSICTTSGGGGGSSGGGGGDPGGLMTGCAPETRATGNNVYGSWNTAIGNAAGVDVNGYSNIALGDTAGQGVQSSDTTSIGTRALASQWSAIAIGRDAKAQQFNGVAIGPEANSYGAGAIAIGEYSVANGESDVYIGGAAGEGGAVTNFRNAGLGERAGSFVTGSDNTAAGPTSGNNVTGLANFAGGAYAGSSVTGSYNVAIGGVGSVCPPKGGGGDNLVGGGSNGGHGSGGNNRAAPGKDSGLSLMNCTPESEAAGVNVTGDRNVAMGNVAGVGITADDTVAVGTRALASADSAIAVGTDSRANAIRSAALGENAQANNADDVALGSNSVTAGPTAFYDPTFGTDTASIKGTTPQSVVSVGTAGNERQITNVAAGGADTDAVNVSQLKAVQKMADAGWNVTTAKTGTGTVAGTVVANVAPGATQTITAGNNIAITQAGTDLTIATNPNLVSDSLTINGGPVINSTGIDVKNTKIVNVAAGTNGTDAVNVNQLTNTQNALTAAGLNFTDAAGHVIHRDLGSTLPVIGSTTVRAAGLDTSGVATTGSYSAQNVQTYADPTTGKLQVQLADNPNFTSVKTGNTTMNTSGVTIVGGSNGPVSLTNIGLNNGGNTITNVAAGVNGTDGVNVNQLTQVSNVANKGWNVTTAKTGTGTVAGTVVANVAPGATQTITAGNNIAINQAGTDLTIATNPNLVSDSLTINGGPVINSTGITLAAGDTLNMAGNTIVNVGPGVNGTDAVNVNQLNAAKTHYYSVNSTGGGNFNNDGATGVNAIAAGKDASSTQYGGVAMGVSAASGGPGAIAIGSQSSAAGNSAIAIGTMANSAGQSSTVIGAQAGFAGTAANSAQTAIGSFAGAFVVGDVNTSVGFAAGNSVTGRGNLGLGAQSGQNLSGDYNVGVGMQAGYGTVGSRNVQVGLGIDPATGNIVEIRANDTVSVGTMANAGVDDAVAIGNRASTTAVGGVALGSKSVASTAAGIAGYIPTGASVLQQNAITATTGTLAAVSVGDAANGQFRQITGVAAGTANSDAVNVAQLLAVQSVAGAGWNTTTAKTGTGTVTGTAIANVAPGATVTTTAGNNIAITQNGTDLTIATNPNLVSDSLTINGGPVINNTGITMSVGDTLNMAGNTITNVGPGVNGTDAVNVNQLTQVSTVANRGWDLTTGATGSGVANGGSLETIAPGEKVTYQAGNNLVVTQTGNTVNYGLNPIVTGLTSVSITGGPTINNTGIHNLAAGVDLSDAVNVGQLNTAIGNVALNFSADTGGLVTRKTGETLAIRGVGSTGGTYSGANLKTVADPATGAINIQMTDKPVFTSVTTGGTTIDNAGLTIVGGPSVLVTGIDAGNKVITSVAPGVNGTDAVNVNQLTQVSTVANRGWDLTTGATGTGVANGGSVEAIAPGEKVTYQAGNNLIVTQTGNTVNYGLNPIVTGLTSVSITGGPTINNTGIHNLAAGVDLADAVNVSQLNMAIGNAALNFSADTGGLITRKTGQTLAIRGEGTTGGTYSGANLKTVADPETGVINIQMTDKPVFTSVTTGATTIDNAGLTIVGGPSVLATGIDAGGKVITNVAPGVNGTDGVNVNQLTQVSTAANRGWDMTTGATGTGIANGGSLETIAPGEKVTFQAGNNLIVTQTGNTVNYALNPVVSGLTSVSITGGPTIDNTGIHNLAAGVALTDAVNVGQLNSAIGNVSIGFSGNSGGVVTRHSGQTLAIQGGATTAGTYSGGNIKTVTDPETGAVNIQIADAPKFGNVTINDGGSGKITGVTAGTLSSTSTDAVNGSQLFAVGDSMADALGGSSTFDPATGKVTAGLTVGGNTYNNVQDALIQVSNTANAGWNTTTAATGTGTVSGTTVANVAPGATVTTTAGNNISITQNGTGLTIATNPNLVSDSLTINGGPVINNTGITMSAGDTINMGGNTITNVGPGVNGTDAVNVNQLNLSLSNAYNYTDNRINALSFNLQEFNRDANGGSAAAMAMSQVPQAFEPGMGMAGVGVSTWQGEQAIAFGFSKASDNGRVVIKATGTYNTRGKGGAAAGLGIQF